MNNKNEQIVHMSEDEWKIKFTSKLADAIGESRMTQQQLAEKTGVSQSLLSNYLNGKTIPTAYRLQKIADAIHCDMKDLVMFD